MRPAFWLFITFFALYALTSGGHFYASDDVQKLAVLDALWEHHSVTIPHGWVKVAGGLRYSWFPLGSSLVMLPGWAVGKLAIALFPAVPPTYAVRFCVTLENAAITAALVALVYAFARRGGARSGQSTFAATVAGLGTMLWPYAKTAWSEPAACLALYAGLYLLLRARRLGATDGRLLAAGLGFAGAFAIREELALAAAGAFLWWAFTDRGPGRARSLAVLAIPLSAAVVATLGYDAWRYGSPVDFPAYLQPQAHARARHPEGPFERLVNNLYLYTLSPNQGIAWYSPGLFASLLAVGSRPARTGMGGLFVAALAPLAVFYTVGWGVSSWAWGLRYSYVFVPALAIASAHAWRPGRRLAAGLCLALGLAVQLLAITPNFLTLYERELLHHPRFTIRTLLRAPEHAPLLLAWHDAPGLLANGASALAHGPGGAGSLRERGERLPDVWWLLVLLEPVPRWAVWIVVTALAGGFAAALAGLRAAVARADAPIGVE